MSRPIGMAIVTPSFVDSSHAESKGIRRFHLGHILFVNQATVKWLIRRQ